MKASNHLYKNLSRQFIVEALLDLMNEKSYQDISVTDITTKAQIARRTFYYNFNGKEEVLQEYLNVMFMKFTEYLQSRNAELLPEVAEGYFTFWKSEKDFILLLQKNGLFILLLGKFEEVLKLYSPDKTEGGFEKKLTVKERQYFDSFNAAGLWILLEQWLKSGMEESPEKMAKIYLHIVGVE